MSWTKRLQINDLWFIRSHILGENKIIVIVEKWQKMLTYPLRKNLPNTSVHETLIQVAMYFHQGWKSEFSNPFTHFQPNNNMNKKTNHSSIEFFFAGSTINGNITINIQNHYVQPPMKLIRMILSNSDSDWIGVDYIQPAWSLLTFQWVFETSVCEIFKYAWINTTSLWIQIVS